MSLEIMVKGDFCFALSPKIYCLKKKKAYRKSGKQIQYSLFILYGENVSIC